MSTDETRAAIRANRTSISIIAPLSAGLDALASMAVTRGWLPISEAMGFRTLLLLVLLALIPEDIYRRVSKRLAGRGSTDDIHPGPPRPPKGGR